MEYNYEAEKQGIFTKMPARMIGNIIILAVVTAISFLLSSRNFVLFHTIIQMFTSVVAFSILIVAVNTYGISKNNFFMFLGIGYAFVGIFDVIHTITYPGVGIIKTSNLNISLQASIMALFVEAFTTLLSYRLIKNKCKTFRPNIMVMIISVIALSAVLAIFYKNIFPDISNEFYEPTVFRRISQLIILLLLGVSAFLYYKIRHNIGHRLFIYLEHSIVAKIICVLLFVFSEPYDSLNVLLHVAKFMSFYYIYKALIDVGLKSHYEHLYYEIDAANEKIIHEKKMRKTIEETFISNEECYRILIDSSKDAIVVYSQRKYEYANSEALRYLGVTHIDELKGKAVDDFIEDLQKENVCNKIKEVFEQKRAVPFFETKLKTSCGNIRDVETAGAYFINEGKPAMLAIIRDIGYKKQVSMLKEDVKKSTELLNESREYNKLITDFISNISHELRTPLNVILSAVQVLNLGTAIVDDENRRKRYFDIMKQNCYRLLKLVNNFIDISKIDSGYLQLNLQNHNIVDAVENITLSVANYVEDKGVNLIFDTDTEEKLMACDLDKIERIMLNLLSNAIKFTSPGDTIDVYLEDAEDEVRISVKDTGLGIPEDDIDIIFERFKQVDKSFTRKHEGSGIGLALVKSLIEMHKGTIEVKSVLGEGSEFIIKLPVEKVSEDNNEQEDRYEENVERIKVEFSDIYSYD
jgi:PAS domain S-box-containing protein